MFVGFSLFSHSLVILCRQVLDTWRHYNLSDKATAGIVYLGEFNGWDTVFLAAKCCGCGCGHVSSSWNFWHPHRLKSCTLLSCSNLWETMFGCMKMHGKGSRTIWAEPSLIDSEFLSFSCFQHFTERSWFSCWKQVFVIPCHCIRMVSHAKTSKACWWNKEK